jgi:hypothetical protein
VRACTERHFAMYRVKAAGAAVGDAHPNSVSSGEGRDENHVQVIFKSKLFIDELPEIEEEAIITGCPDLAVSLDEI